MVEAVACCADLDAPPFGLRVGRLVRLRSDRCTFVKPLWRESPLIGDSLGGAMIDRAARDQLADAIRALAAGVISNDQFERRVPDSLDPAIREIFANGAWGLYSDLFEHKLRGSHRLPEGTRSEIARWILFLKTDRPYSWPVLNPGANLMQALLSIATFGAAATVFRRRFARQGDISVWPFIDHAHYQAALLAPPYLRGAA